METIALRRPQSNERDRLFGLGISLLMHLTVVAFALYAPGSSSVRAIELPVYNVDLVSASDVKMPEKPAASAPKAKTVKAATPRQVGAAPVQKIRPDSGPTVATKDSIQRIENTPKIDLDRVPVAPIEETLDRLMPADVDTEINVDEKLEKVIEPEAIQTPKETSRQASTGTAPKGGLPGTAGGVPGTAGKDTGEIALARRLYYASVWDKIRRQWALPQTYLGSTDIEAVLILNVSRDGRILNVRFEKRSGSALFDDSVLRAVRKADPLPPFPDIYSPSREEIGVRFRPEDLH